MGSAIRKGAGNLKKTSSKKGRSVKTLDLGLGWKATDDGTIQAIENPNGELVYVAREDVPFNREVFRTIYNAFQCGVRLGANVLGDLKDAYPNI